MCLIERRRTLCGVRELCSRRLPSGLARACSSHHMPCSVQPHKFCAFSAAEWRLFRVFEFCFCIPAGRSAGGAIVSSPARSEAQCRDSRSKIHSPGGTVEPPLAGREFAAGSSHRKFAHKPPDSTPHRRRFFFTPTGTCAIPPTEQISQGNVAKVTNKQC